MFSLFGGEEEDDPKCFNNPVLTQLYEQPDLALNLTQNSEPWDFRDKLRRNCIALLSKPVGYPWKKGVRPNPAYRGINSYFNEGDPPLLPHKEALFAYNLCIKKFKTDLKIKKAQDVKLLLDSGSAFFRGHPMDILHTKRPIHANGYEPNPAVRACGMAAIEMVETESTVDEYGFPETIFVCLVSYCMRMHTIKKRSSEFSTFHKQICEELLMVPGFPDRFQADTMTLILTLGMGGETERGHQLAKYCQRIFDSLATRGVFSPRLMDFLGIDYARVHIEEDGRMAQILDSVSLGRGSCWHMIHESWLKKWRKFVLCRGARRYQPPGPVSNYELLRPKTYTVTTTYGVDVEKHGWEVVENMLIPGAEPIEVVETDVVTGEVTKHYEQATEPIKCGKHYRAVNFNMVQYWRLVHGGGPLISRKNKDIMSPPACGYMEAVFRMECFGRLVIAKQLKDKLFWLDLSRNGLEVREQLAKAARERIHQMAQDRIQDAIDGRQTNRLFEACQFTQRNWRTKKLYEYADEGLKIMKHAQEVFADAEGRIEQATGNQPFVVEENDNVISFGSVEEYEVVFTEEMGLSIGLKKHVASEITFVHSVPADLGPPTNDRTRPESTLASPIWRWAKVPIESTLCAINDYPVSALTHDQVMSRLTKISWPLKLKFQRPLFEEDVKPLPFVVNSVNGDLDGGSDDIKLQMLKRLLSRGVPLIKHCKNGKPHPTILYLSEHMIFWVKREAEAALKKATAKPVYDEKTESWKLQLSKKYMLTNGISLYDLRYVRSGKLSGTFKRGASKSAKPDSCFSLFAEERNKLSLNKKEGGEGKAKTLDFEFVAGADGGGLDPGEARKTLVWAFDKIINEARGSKFVLDKAGNLIHRLKPKSRLRIITG